MYSFLSHVPSQYRAEYSDPELCRVFAELDSDANGGLSFLDFMRFARRLFDVRQVYSDLDTSLTK